MIPVLYTNTDQIRGIAGLSAKDVSDDDIVARGLETELLVELQSWLPDHETVSITETTADDIYQKNCLELYCAYLGAALVVNSPLLILQTVGDGQNEMARFSSLDLKQIAADLTTRAGFFRGEIQRLHSAAAATTFQPFTAAGLAVDPVTG